MSSPVSVPTVETLSFPWGAKLYFYGYTNAAWQQDITLNFNNGSTPLHLKGNGEGNHPTTPPVVTFQIPAGPSSAPGGFPATGAKAEVKISHNPGSGAKPSFLQTGAFSVENKFNMAVVTSEDSNDGDFNDCVLVAMWYK